MKKEKIIIACDHGGYALKRFLLNLLNEKGFGVEDLGTHSSDPVDYPDYGQDAAQRIASGKNRRAVLICGTGIGMSITANRYHGVRAALCNEAYSAKMSRLHNDSNVLVIGGRVVGEALAGEIISTWLDTDFEAGGRHARRISKIDKDRRENK